jgi:hypothetical protein
MAKKDKTRLRIIYKHVGSKEEIENELQQREQQRQNETVPLNTESQLKTFLNDIVK